MRNDSAPFAGRVDAAVNVFGKPYQTALSVLSLLRSCGGYIDRVYFQFEPFGSSFDPAPPYAVAHYLGERAVIHQPAQWLQRNAPDKARLAGDEQYRLSVRYQHAWERTDKDFLLIVHNDVFITRDVVGAMLERVEGAFAVGGIGQCWNCPARLEEVVRACTGAAKACTPATYAEFRPSFEELGCLYQTAAARGVFVRHYWEGWQESFASRPWPLPECRVNEWACLVNMALARPATAPLGPATPFGAFEACGSLYLDTAVAWFRDMHAQGLQARHLDTGPFLKHWVGTGKKTRQRYQQAEDNARLLLQRHFKEFVQWCKTHDTGLFV